MRRAAPAAALLGLLACSSTPPPPIVGHGMPLEDVAKYVRGVEAIVRTLEGQARVRTETKEQVRSFDADILVERPQRFRMVAIAHGTTAFDLLLDGRDLTVYVPSENTVIRRRLGEGTADPAAKMTGVEALFSRTGLPRLILGAGRFDPQEDWRLLDRNDEKILVGLFDGSRQVGELLVEEGTLVKLRERLMPPPGGGSGVTVSYAGYRPVAKDGPYWAHELSVESREEQFAMDFRFHDIRLNEPLPEGAFDPGIPADAKPPQPK
ncbi:MAG: DUF4292 domain-containing protein [Planctomycetales bacterium]|nr:DUF4292 domain-containing protein [Planctomycetales bacterium]